MCVKGFNQCLVHPMNSLVFWKQNKHSSAKFLGQAFISKVQSDVQWGNTSCFPVFFQWTKCHKLNEPYRCNQKSIKRVFRDLNRFIATILCLSFSRGTASDHTATRDICEKDFASSMHICFLWLLLSLIHIVVATSWFTYWLSVFTLKLSHQWSIREGKICA